MVLKTLVHFCISNVDRASLIHLCDRCQEENLELVIDLSKFFIFVTGTKREDLKDLRFP